MMVYTSSQSAEEGEPSSEAAGPANQDITGASESAESTPPVAAVEILEVEKSSQLIVEAIVEESTASLPPPVLVRQTSLGNSVPGSSSFSAAEITSKSFTSTPGYLANRWNSVNSSFSTPSFTQASTFATPPLLVSLCTVATHKANLPSFRVSQPASCPERIDESITTPSSHVRLSMSLDGKAELITSSPSPPRQRAPRPTSFSASMVPQKRVGGGLQRSQSAITFGPRLSMFSTYAFAQPRLPTGRSRDARTWEFCCDGETRDELTTQAENESHGSAVAAISLLRSSSNSALKLNSNKRNNPALKQDSSKHGKKPKLARATSSLARLQNTGKSSSKLSSKDGLMRSPSGDSDKENWMPNENGGNARRRPLPSGKADSFSTSRAVLGENNNVPSHAVDFGGNKNRKRNPAAVAEIFEDKENSAEVGEEVEKFMRGEVSPSKKGDLDCIQGLLSLSQGNWR